MIEAKVGDRLRILSTHEADAHYTSGYEGKCGALASDIYLAGTEPGHVGCSILVDGESQPRYFYAVRFSPEGGSTQ